MGAKPKTTFVYGPNSRAMTRCAEEIRQYLGCNLVVDLWNMGELVLQGAVHLTTESPPSRPGAHRWIAFADLPREVRS